jgi:UDP-glucuronate decarboxylase
MKIFLTGGTGFFGRSLLRFWLSTLPVSGKITSVCVLSRNPQKFLKQYPEFFGHTWLQFHQGDILIPTSLPKNGGFSHILHAAADSTLGPQLTPLDRYSQIVDGTRNLLDYAAKCGIQRFLLTSSGAVYGPQPQDMDLILEDYNGMPDPLSHENAYSVAKRCAEHICAIYRNRFGIEIVIARCFTFIGRDLPLDAHFAIGNFINDAISRNEILVRGDGCAVRTYLDQRDLAHWLTIMLTEGVDGEAYNVGSDVPITIKELAFLVRDNLAPIKKVIISSHTSTKNFRERYVPSIDKAKKQLSLKVQFSIQEAIQEVITSFKK